MPQAFSYLRFSTPEQERGDSFRRQKDLAERYAAKHGLTLDHRSFQDLGVSAYRGANAGTGALRRFLEAVEEGSIPVGSYLLVESLDRVSRDQILAAQGLFLQIIQAGVTLVTLSNERSYSAASINANPTDLIISIVEMMRAHEESATKARRLKAVWADKRSKGHSTKLTARCPAWLKLKADRSAFEVVEARALVVQRIFEEFVNGAGQHRIAQRLNRENVATFGRSKYWQRSYISKILQNPAVIGTLVPHETEHVQWRRKRRPCREIKNYYPAVVDEGLYSRALSMRVGANLPRVSSGGTVSHLFAGLARCPHCGSAMTRVNKGRQPKGGYPYLVCAKAKVGGDCAYRGVRVDKLEATLVSKVVRLRDGTPRKATGIASMIRDMAGRKAEAERAVQSWLDKLKKAGPLPTTPHAVLDKIAYEEKKLREADAALRQLSERAALVVGANKKAAELGSALQAKELDVAKANSLMRQLFYSVVIDKDRKQMSFEWKHGGATTMRFAA